MYTHVGAIETLELHRVAGSHILRARKLHVRLELDLIPSIVEPESLVSQIRLIKIYPCLSCSPRPTGKMGRVSLPASFGSFAKKSLMFLKIIPTPRPSLEYSTHIQIFIT